MRVVVADDSALLREGLQLILTEAGHDIIGAVGTGTEFVPLALELKPDVSVVDVRMPPSNTDEGMRAAVQVRQEWPDAKIMLLSQYIEVSYATELLASGAGGIGYLLKDRVTKVDDFVSALERVAAGGTALDPQVVAQFMAKPDQPLAELTPREQEVLGYMAEGLSNLAIGQAMVISRGAVEKHCRSVFQKLGLAQDESENRRVLAVLAYLRGTAS